MRKGKGTERRVERIKLAAVSLEELAVKVQSGQFTSDEEIARELRSVLDNTLEPWASMEDFKNPVRKFIGREYQKKLVK